MTVLSGGSEYKLIFHRNAIILVTQYEMRLAQRVV